MTSTSHTVVPCSPTASPDGNRATASLTAHASRPDEVPPAALVAEPPGGLLEGRTGPRSGERSEPFRWQAAAWIAPDDVPRLAAALGPEAVVVPCDSLDALAAAVRGGAAAAVVGPLALGASGWADLAGLAGLMNACPATVFAGIATDPDEPIGWGAHMGVVQAECRRSRERVLAFGRPATDADWALLNRSLAAARLADPVQRTCVAAVLSTVWGAARTEVDATTTGPAEAALFQSLAAAFAPGVDTRSDVAARLGVDGEALADWFARCGLPGVDRYIAGARLVRAAWTGEAPTPGVVAAAVRPVGEEVPADCEVHAYLQRTVRSLRRRQRLAAAGTSAPRRRTSPARSAGAIALHGYCAALVAPFEDVLYMFDPAGATAP